MTKILNQNTQFGSVTETMICDGFPAIEINHPTCQAKLSLYGGQVLAWQPIGEKEVFWLSNAAIYQTGKAIRGGIPVCWPWFGPLEGSTQHGFVRQVLWQLEHVSVTELGVTLVISWQGENMDTLWPHAVKIQQTFFFGKAFQQAFSITNLSTESIKHTVALHSYFKVSSPDHVTAPLLNEVEFDDKLTGERVQPFARKNCQGPIDTVYYCAQPQKLIDTGWNRIIEITNCNTNQWVLWNPGVETAKKMADVHLHGEQEYVCLEAANTQWQEIPAQQTVVFSQRITVKALN